MCKALKLSLLLLFRDIHCAALQQQCDYRIVAVESRIAQCPLVLLVHVCSTVY